MADDRLMLSALKTSKTYSLINNVSQRRCLIHVKLTDLCMKTVENLVDSDKVGNTCAVHQRHHGGSSLCRELFSHFGLMTMEGYVIIIIQLLQPVRYSYHCVRLCQFQWTMILVSSTSRLHLYRTGKDRAVWSVYIRDYWLLRIMRYASMTKIYSFPKSVFKKKKLSCWGTMEHKATVQATDEVYLQTKKNWESVEKLRKEKTAQEIKVPQGKDD